MSEFDFGLEVSKILPLIIRECTSRSKTIFSEHRLSIPCVVILDLLRENGPSKMGGIAQALSLTMSAATGIVDKMISQGLVKRERSLEDRRIVRVEFKKKGEEIAGKIREERKNASNEIFSVLTESERKEYLRLLRKVHDGLI